MDSAEGARDWLCTPEAQVSAHYVISPQGTIWQLVDEANRAWHAGVGQWGDVADVNSHSIGIELSNTGSQPFAEPLMAALEGLLPGILSRWGIPPERVIGHSDMAPGRKIDPGRRFDWRRLAMQGLAVWPDETFGEGSTPWRDHAHSFGYCLDALTDHDDPEAVVLDAFRARFRPWATGPLDDEDRRIARNLSERFPVDATPPSA